MRFRQILFLLASILLLVFVVLGLSLQKELLFRLSGRSTHTISPVLSQGVAVLPDASAGETAPSPPAGQARGLTHPTEVQQSPYLMPLKTDPIDAPTEVVTNIPAGDDRFLPETTEWIQAAHDAQHSGYTQEEPSEPWTFLWAWNGPAANGSSGNHLYDAPPNALTITGGDQLYAPAGDAGLYALNLSDGKPTWHLEQPAFNATPAYHPGLGYLFAGSSNGNLYQIEASSGKILRNYPIGAPINTAVVLSGPSVYALSSDGSLARLDSKTLQPVWIFRTQSPASGPPAVSVQKSLAVFCTEDLVVHAVDTNSGNEIWQARPSVLDPGPPYTFSGYWPVIAEQNGLVFVRLNLGMSALWSGTDAKNRYPGSNLETRQHLIAQPELKNLFALDLATGKEKFIPAVGFGGVETLVDGHPDLASGPVPVIRRWSGSSPSNLEVAYLPFRSGQGDPPDGRWDSHLGEMVLNDTSIPGLSAGDLRFIQFDNSYIKITDEQGPLTMAGETIFHAHWGASESILLLDRSPQKGFSYRDPLPSSGHPVVIRRIQACGDFDSTTHWTSCPLTLFQDGRLWNGPGWWVYWNSMDPPTPVRGAYSEGLRPRYTYVSSGLVIVEGNGGEIMVFQHK